MSVIYPFCNVADVERLSVHGESFGATTQPTLSQVKVSITDISTHMRSIISDAGYDLDNLHEVSASVAAAITAGNDVALTVGTGEGASFTKQETIKIEGLTSGVLSWEFVVLKSISTDVLTITTIANSYDAGTVTLYTVNTALRMLRDINALGATAKAEDATFAGITRGDAERESKYWAQYNGSQVTRYGLWAILNIPEFLLGATVTTEATTRGDLDSYGRQHETDSDMNPWFTRSMEF